jgi:hypothetical protein
MQNLPDCLGRIFSSIRPLRDALLGRRQGSSGAGWVTRFAAGRHRSVVGVWVAGEYFVGV